MNLLRLFNITIRIAAVTLLLLLTVSYLSALYLGYRAERELSEATGHPWQVSLRSIWCNPFAQRLSLNHISIESEGVASIIVERIEIDDIFGATFKNGVSLGAIRIYAPDLDVESRERLHHIGKRLKGAVYIAELDIEGAVVKVEGKQASALDLSMEQITIDSTMISSYNIDIHNNRNSIELSSLEIDRSEDAISISGLTLKPIASIDQLLSGDISNWNSFTLDTITVKGINLTSLTRASEIAIDTIEIAYGEVNSYKNRKAITTKEVKPLLYQWLQGLNRALKIDYISFKDIDINYSEIDTGSQSPGEISFSRLYGSIKNIDNRAAIGSIFTIDAAAMVERAAWATIQIDMPGNVADDNFTIVGTLGTMPLSRFNTITTPLLHMQVESGTLNSLAFTITGNSHSSKCDLTMLYDSLRVSILKEGINGYKERELLTTIGNKKINHSNPRGEVVYTGEGTFVRDPLKSQFNYLWRSLESGIKPTIISPRR